MKNNTCSGRSGSGNEAGRSTEFTWADAYDRFLKATLEIEKARHETVMKLLMMPITTDKEGHYRMGKGEAPVP